MGLPPIRKISRLSNGLLGNELLEFRWTSLTRSTSPILDLDGTFRAVLDSISPHDDREHRY